MATEDFPAWLLLQDSGAFGAIPPSETSTDDRDTAYRLLHGLVTGEDTIDRRRALGEIHPDLLRQFLAYRNRR